MSESLDAFTIVQTNGDQMVVAAKNIRDAFDYYMNNQIPGKDIPSVGIIRTPVEELQQFIITVNGTGEKINVLDLLNKQKDPCFLFIDSKTLC